MSCKLIKEILILTKDDIVGKSFFKITLTQLDFDLKDIYPVLLERLDDS